MSNFNVRTSRARWVSGMDARCRLSIMTAAMKFLRRRGRHALPGQFQPYNHTLPDRYPWLFEFARAHLRDADNLRLMSFGCSRGEEVFSLRRYFPAALIKGIDVNARDVAIAANRAHAEAASGLCFTTAADTSAEPSAHYDAIFCLAVLVHGDLTARRAERSDPTLQFENFERMVQDFARCLRRDGLLFLHTTNFRFSDTRVAHDFDVVLEAQLDQLAPDVLFGRDNRLLPGVRYCPVAFRKRGAVT
jgi:SAM-dependent methyltransferase